MNDKLRDLRSSPEFAEERLVSSFQSLLQETLERRGMSKSDLAKKMGVSKARVSQMFSDSQNFTLRLIANAFFALGEEVSIRRSSDLEFKSMPPDECEEIYQDFGNRFEAPHGLEWLGPQIEAMSRPIARQVEIDPETTGAINRAIKAALQNCLSERQSVAELSEMSLTTDSWINDKSSNVVPMKRRKAG